MTETVIRIRREDGYTVLPNRLLRDDRLSLKTKGLFCMMLSFPGDWTYSICGLVSMCGTGRDAIRGALRELEAAGYLGRERSHAEDGRFCGMIYTLQTVSSMPRAENPFMDDPSAPLSDFPTLDKPTSENPTVQNKDYINTPYSPPRGGRGQTRKQGRHDPDLTHFEAFWSAYPKKRAKDKALRAWRRLNPDEALCRTMAAALEHAKASREWQKEGGAYIPYPATWINGRRWEDESDPTSPLDDSAAPMRPKGGRWI